MAGKVIREIDSVELQQLLSAGGGVNLLDIRSEAEVMQGVLPASRHLPMRLLPLKIGEFPADQDVILYCRSGARSAHACMYLMQQGFKNVINLRGGILDWARHGFEIVAPS